MVEANHVSIPLYTYHNYEHVGGISLTIFELKFGDPMTWGHEDSSPRKLLGMILKNPKDQNPYGV